MRVVIADDTMLIREGTARLLAEAGFEIAGKAGDAGQLLRAVALDHPDVAIVDIKMPPTHTDEGLVAAEQIRAAHPNVAVLVLSFFNLLVHSRDAWTSVVPTGLILSIIVVLILPFTAWLGWSMVYRCGVGVLR